MSAKLVVIVGPRNTGKTLAAYGIAQKYREIFKTAEVINDPVLPGKIRSATGSLPAVTAAIARKDVVIVTSSDIRVLRVVDKPAVFIRTEGSLG